MARITGSIQNLFNGVSQQTPALRLPTQGAEQLNFYPSLVQGLVKRPPLEIINDSIQSDALSLSGTTHLVDRGSDNANRERCFLYVTNKGITAFRPDGTVKPVEASPEALNYLAKGGTSRFSLLTVADHTFISNPAVNTSLGTAKSAPHNGCGFVQVKQAAYETQYGIDVTIKLNTGVNVTYSAKCKTWTSLGTEEKPKPKVTIDAIVAKLLYELTADKSVNAISNTVHIASANGNQGSGGDERQNDKDYTDDWDGGSSGKRRGKTEEEKTEEGETEETEGPNPEFFEDALGNWNVRSDIPFRAVASGSVIYICPKEGNELVNIHATDSEGDQLIRSIFKTTARFSDLPAKCVDGTIVKITGDDTTRFNDYYVIFNADVDKVKDDNFLIHDGSWKECPAPDIVIDIDFSTMPHILVDEGDKFVFKPCSQWADRTCGDDDTCPIPDFIGYPVTGMFQYRNRLGFLSEDIVALSEASEYFNWWNTTAMTQVDSDPIYLSASVEGAPMLRWALPFNEEVILFSDRAQFKLVAPDTLSPATAAVNTVTYYAMNNDIKPVSNGRNIFFCDTQGHTALQNSTRVYEYFLDSDSGTKAAMEITSHVPQYIDSGVTDMTCSSGLSLLALYKQNDNRLWLYKYYWSGNEKLQTAWFLNVFGDKKPRNILGAEFIGDVLYCLMYSEGGYFLCRMDFSITLDDTAPDPSLTGDFPIYLDMLNDYTFKGQYDAYDNKTYVEIPSYYDPDTVAIVDLSTMREIERSGYTEYGHIVLNGQYTESSRLKIGETYPSVYAFSPALVRSSSGNDGQGQLATHMGTLMLQHWRLILGPTGYLEVQILHDDGRVFAYPRTALNLLYPGHLLGRVNSRELETFEVPVRGDAKHIVVKINNPTWFPSTIISAEWDGNYITKGRQHL